MSNSNERRVDHPNLNEVKRNLFNEDAEIFRVFDDAVEENRDTIARKIYNEHKNIIDELETLKTTRQVLLDKYLKLKPKKRSKRKGVIEFSKENAFAGAGPKDTARHHGQPSPSRTITHYNDCLSFGNNEETKSDAFLDNRSTEMGFIDIQLT